MLKIGHRGAPSKAPENTLSSFGKALELGVDAVELDVHLCKSGEIMVIHDETLERTTNGKGAIKNHTLTQLKKLDAGKGEKIPTLQEVYDFLCGRAGILIEVKDKKAAGKVAEFVKGKKNLYVISFYADVLAEVKKENKTVKIGYNFDEDNMPTLEKIIKNLKPYSINPCVKILSSEIVELAHKNKVKVITWTANKKSEIEFARKLGVDGIMSDYPERIYI